MHRSSLSDSKEIDSEYLVQNVPHIIVNECPLTMVFDSDLQRLYITDDNAINWLDQTAMKALGDR